MMVSQAGTVSALLWGVSTWATDLTCTVGEYGLGIPTPRVANSPKPAAEEEIVDYWMHNNMVTVNGQKMGKSLNNFITLEQFFEGYPA